MTDWGDYEAAVEHYLGPLDEIDFDVVTWMPKPDHGWSMARQLDYERWGWEMRWKVRGRLRWRWRRPELFGSEVGGQLSDGGKEREVPGWRVVLLGFEITRYGEGYPRSFGPASPPPGPPGAANRKAGTDGQEEEATAG